VLHAALELYGILSMGGKSIQLGAISPETLARQLLLKLAKEGKA